VVNDPFGLNRRGDHLDLMQCMPGLALNRKRQICATRR
jgi:hypothetical protein